MFNVRFVYSILKFRLKCYWMLVFMVLWGSVLAQKEFQNPLNIPMLDIKTQDKEGLPVLSTADGWVSRIKVSPWGFGTALYINHPNGYTSVYAHLSDFNKEIADYVLKHQYQKKSYSVDLYLKKGQISVKALDTIAFSGNTGGSGGPHLHFELRTTANQKPCNPLDLGIDIKDDLPPILKKILVYENEHPTFYNLTKKSESEYSLDTILLSCSSPKFAIHIKDYSNDSRNPLGINRIKYFVNEELWYQFDLKSFLFKNSRYVNAHIDYGVYKETKERFHKLYVDAGNKLDAYQSFDKPYFFGNQAYRNVRIEVYDSKYNKSVLNFVVKKQKASAAHQSVQKGMLFHWDKNNTFRHQDFSLTTPANSFYKDFYFDWEVSDNKSYIGNSIYKIGNPLIPIHKKVNFRIKVPDLKSDELSKLCLVEIEDDKVSAVSSRVTDGYLFAKIRTFGTFGMLIDTVPPTIKLVSENLNYKHKAFIFKISDDLSGIDKYSAFLNGKWILFKYDYKTDYYYYDRDFSLQKTNSKQTLEIKVTDEKGNKSNYVLDFVY